VALIPFLQNSRVAALSKRPRADSSSPPAMCSATIRFFVDDLPMRAKLIELRRNHQVTSSLADGLSQLRAK
jgi:hypothetical protein